MGLPVRCLCLGILVWLPAAALLAQQIPTVSPNQQNPTAPMPTAQSNQRMPTAGPYALPPVYATNPNTTGPRTGDTQPNRPNYHVNPPTALPPLGRPDWPPSTSTSPDAVRALRGQPARPYAPHGGSPRTAALAPRQPPQPPIQLTPEEQAQVDQILQLWEEKSDKVVTYKCEFDRFEYDPTFLQGVGGQIALTISKGKISYKKPDKGKFEITEVKKYNPDTRAHEKEVGAPNEHWVCTGDAVYEIKEGKKELVKQEIPPDQRGKAIADGPLPFLFGAKAEKLKQRYWIRVFHLTPEEIWLEAYPRWQADAANYSKVEIILDREEFLPTALQLHSPGGKRRESYNFGKASVNNRIDRYMPFQKPRAGFGWTLIDETPRGQPPAGQPMTGRRDTPAPRQGSYEANPKLRR